MTNLTWLLMGIVIGCVWMGLSVFVACWWGMRCGYRDDHQDHSSAHRAGKPHLYLV